MNDKPSFTILIGATILERAENLIRSSFSEMHPIYRIREQDFRLYLPSIAITLMSEAAFKKYYYLGHPFNALKHLHGIKILEGYENAIVLAHKDAVMEPERKLVFKATLQ